MVAFWNLLVLFWPTLYFSTFNFFRTSTLTFTRKFIFVSKNDANKGILFVCQSLIINSFVCYFNHEGINHVKCAGRGQRSTDDQFSRVFRKHIKDVLQKCTISMGLFGKQILNYHCVSILANISQYLHFFVRQNIQKNPQFTNFFYF